MALNLSLKEGPSRGPSWGGLDTKAEPSLGQLLLNAPCLGLLTVLLALAGLLLVLVPQRMAQRPARSGVIVIHLERSGGLRLWHQPIREAELFPLLERAVRDRRGATLRLVSDAEVPWGRVQAIADRARAFPYPLELQLP